MWRRMKIFLKKHFQWYIIGYLRACFNDWYHRMTDYRHLSIIESQVFAQTYYKLHRALHSFSNILPQIFPENFIYHEIKTICPV